MASPPPQPAPPQVDSEDLDPSDDEIIAQRNIVQKLKRMSVNPNQMRYQGKSSSLFFIQTALDLKHEYAAIHLPTTVDEDAHNVLFRRHQQCWSLHPVRTSSPRVVESQGSIHGLTPEILRSGWRPQCTMRSLHIKISHRPA